MAESFSGRRYSSFHRPFRLQLSPSAAEDFEGPASYGGCQYVDEQGIPCDLFEWENGRCYCRTHWLLVHQADRLPERWYASE
jgi:hypothetical protein